MTIYEQYARAKITISQAQKIVDDLQPKILEEMANLSTGLKIDQGTFSIKPTTTIVYSDKLQAKEKKMKDKLTALKYKEVEQGIAKVETKKGLVFRANSTK